MIGFGLGSALPTTDPVSRTSTVCPAGNSNRPTSSPFWFLMMTITPSSNNQETGRTRGDEQRAAFAGGGFLSLATATAGCDSRLVVWSLSTAVELAAVELERPGIFPTRR